MPLYMCSKCGSVENTALGGYWRQQMEAFEANKKHEPLCSACDPKLGAWHGHFPRRSAAGYVKTRGGYLYTEQQAAGSEKHMGPFTPVELPPGKEKQMTERWFNEVQVEHVARDLQEEDRTMADAMDGPTIKSWEELSQDQQRTWRERATAFLAEIVPLDISRPLRLRDGTPVSNVRLCDEGLSIVADVAAWGKTATWKCDGRSGDEHPADLVYANELAPVE